MRTPRSINIDTYTDEGESQRPHCSSSRTKLDEYHLSANGYIALFSHVHTTVDVSNIATLVRRLYLDKKFE